MVYAHAKPVDSDTIPIVDIAGLLDGSNTNMVARALHDASRNLGFIYIKGHDIPGFVVDAARQCAFEFFHYPRKMKGLVKVSNSHRGWLDQGGAKMRDDARTDLKESFIWGYEDEHGQSPMDGHSLRGANQWPLLDPEMRDKSMQYFNYAQNIAQYLLKGFAVGLGLNEVFFLKSLSPPLSRASYVYYPEQAEELGPEQFGVGPHTDFGVLTVLCQDDVGGLQIKDLQGEWIEAPPIENTLLVNVGDLLSRWTNGIYRSTEHRVVNSSGRERLSLVLAYDPGPETWIDAREVTADVDVESNSPITCGDYLTWRFNKAFAYRADK